ncbi:MAG: class I SAM-dependent methyltransferase [Gammaproteobacteria bacterium]|nr:class I SAM-dependent methyltransferase [Gammaproteobacteria bacterium]
MNTDRYATEFVIQENLRENQFNRIWSHDLKDVFADVAQYYDRANNVAALWTINGLRKKFIDCIELQSGQKALDVCAGTNVIGIDLLSKQPDLEMYAVDRSSAMQRVGGERARKLGFNINSTIHDVHELPFPDNHFDVVTLQYASRHLRVVEVFEEIKRVLKPGGHFYHCDMLRPANKLIEQAYYLYLRASVGFTAWLFGSNNASLSCKTYFIDALKAFYSVEELSKLLREIGFEDVHGTGMLGGTVGFHKAMLPLDKN